jgi:hypothetical protein
LIRRVEPIEQLQTKKVKKEELTFDMKIVVQTATTEEYCTEIDEESIDSSRWRQGATRSGKTKKNIADEFLKSSDSVGRCASRLRYT